MLRGCKELPEGHLLTFARPNVSVRIPILFESRKKGALWTVRERVQTGKAPQAIGAYSQAIKARGLVFASGQIPIDPQTGQFVKGGIAEQTEQVIKNLEAVLIAAGSGLDRVVKTTVFLADIEEFATMNEVYGKYFINAPPARSTVETARLPRDARIEIDAIGLVGEQ